jgi:hypothetical protein
VARFQPAFEGVDLDGAEVVHPVAFGGVGAGDFRWDDMLAFYRKSMRDDAHFAAVGASDYHFFRLLGLCRTYILARDASEGALIEALRAGRTVTVAPDGQRFGDPTLIQALEPLEARVMNVGYAPSSVLDRATRFIAWLGMLALLLARMRSVA